MSVRPDPGSGPSWDDRSRSAPGRPAFNTSLPEHVPLPRPRHVMISLALVGVAALASAAATSIAALDQAALRAQLAADLPESVTADYSDGDVRTAVWVLVGVLVGLGALLTVAQLMSMRTTALRRRLASRTTFLTMTVLYLPVAVLAPAVRQGGLLDDLLTVVDLGCLLVAAVLITRPPVSAWLRQKERTGRSPLVPPAPGDELTPAAAGRRTLGHRPGPPGEDPIDGGGKSSGVPPETEETPALKGSEDERER